MAHSKEIKERIVSLHEGRLSSRKIAKEVFGKESSKSTVNDIIARYYEENAIEKFVGSKDKELASLAKSLRTAQLNNNKLRKIQRMSHDSEALTKELLQGIEQASKVVAKNSVKVVKTFNDVADLGDADIPLAVKPNNGRKTPLTAELLFSDLQIGKLMKNFNTKIAKKRVKEYCDVAILKIKQHQENGYHFDRIVLAMLGDIIESDKKHPNSGRACDTSTAEQMKNAIECLYSDLIEPLALLGIPMDCICITGNHDHDGHGLSMFDTGKVHLSYPLYYSLKMLVEAKGYSHVNFTIPNGVFHVDSIYGFNVLYEHGVGVSTSEASMSKRKQQRSDQLRKHITYFRMGDKHNISRFNEDTLVVNGAFFGGDDTGAEYSSICGYNSDPAQIVIFHTPREDNRLSVYDSLIVQLKHIK